MPILGFQSTYLYKVRLAIYCAQRRGQYCFNPRTYIRYDRLFWYTPKNGKMFQSTYLYKVRQCNFHFITRILCFNPRTYIRYDPDKPGTLRNISAFQSTYLYKVRPLRPFYDASILSFQSTYLYKVRQNSPQFPGIPPGFNPRTYIRYDQCMYNVSIII